jgi:hypothetical protein
VNAQLVNGNFESNGQFDLTGWTSLCNNAFWGIGYYEGDWCVAVPHGESNGCSQGDIIQYVPGIQNGETWTFGGWCMNNNWMQSNPSIGLRQGIKLADGTMTYFTGAVQSGGSWFHLSVTNTFTINPGDTAFVLCDGGLVSGNGNFNWAQFDAMDLQLLATGMDNASERTPAFRPNPADDKLWIDLEEMPISITAIDISGREHRLNSLFRSGRTVELEVSNVAPGLCLLMINTPSGIRSLRFAKR